MTSITEYKEKKAKEALKKIDADYKRRMDAIDSFDYNELVNQLIGADYDEAEVDRIRDLHKELSELNADGKIHTDESLKAFKEEVMKNDIRYSFSIVK